MDCCICLEELDDQSTTLECNHKFHTNCVDKLYDKICPLCRNVISTKSDTLTSHKDLTINEQFSTIENLDLIGSITIEINGVVVFEYSSSTSGLIHGVN